MSTAVEDAAAASAAAAAADDGGAGGETMGIDIDVSDLTGSRGACRFYANVLPETDEVVMVRVSRLDTEGTRAYVTLLEYGGRDGMIMFSELTRRRIRSLSALCRVGQVMACAVTRVDEEKGYIDLSKRRVSEDERGAAVDRFNKARAVHSILGHVADITHVELERVYELVGWPLYRKYEHAYNGLSLMTQESFDEVMEGVESLPQVSEKIKEVLVAEVRRRLTPQPVKSRADIEVTCFQYEGIEAVRKSLRAAAECSTQHAAVRVVLVAPPLYVLTTQTLRKDDGLALLARAIKATEGVIRSLGGRMVVKEAPRIVCERDERQLAAALEKAAAANREIDGDDDEEDGDDDGEGGSGSDNDK